MSWLSKDKEMFRKRHKVSNISHFDNVLICYVNGGRKVTHMSIGQQNLLERSYKNNGKTSLIDAVYDILYMEFPRR